MNLLWTDLRPLLGYLGLFSFCINLLYLAPALFMLQVFDRVLPTNSQETLLVLLAGTAGALVVMLLLDFVRHSLQAVLGNLVEQRLAPTVVCTVVERTARAPHAGGQEGIRDVAALKNLFTSPGLTALFDAPWAPIYLLAIYACHPMLGMGAVLAVALMLALAWLNDRLSRRALEGLQKDGRRASQYVESSLRNAEVLQALGMTHKLLARWRALQDEVTAMQASASRGSVLFAALTRFVRQAIQMLMVALGAYLVLSQQASAGVMIATTVLLGRAIQPVEQVVGSWRMLVDARAAYRRLRGLMAEAGQRGEQMALPGPAGRIDVDNLSYRAAGSDKPILYSIALSLAPGESLAVIGPSAAGKSTLARLMTGVWAASTGAVRLDGVDVACWPRRDLGPWIGYVPQDIELFDGTVAENIARLGQVDAEAVVAAAVRANAHEMIVGLAAGYDTQVGEHGLRLSPGQRQRIALARALYGDPRLVVLDEPNSNLDGAGEVALARAVSGLRSQGVTTIIVTHRPSLIAHVDKILVMDGGRVKRFGPAAEVMKEMQRQSQAAVDRAA
ncbi:type I secretion system permease/ATPase [Noviherbaspirillum suwonense]|jgi:PrtD family type I secretion system ABC transporter|uniref:ATP-binding cassette, subfamily C, exporter for protease/lipase/ATP-binding cassette, subfamily C, EexD n=1 Tax=Noviherbaspirillum suwonense TaxID=1224511 RepID=A0ABY1Q612_9BURK|nr:type I secretion system permease/ATPase [Noviherbaspirillum suwonense]SMP58219.1 ATP-binding cassette, subfamily C, exporter for protease/lipase/ATP-binding cassette, subfamily C, EexD [Noviherbaspirillum suwonense]